MTAGNWETGQPHYSGDRRLHAASTFVGSPSIPYATNVRKLRKIKNSNLFQYNGELASALLQQKNVEPNIVSSIFSQSSPNAIPTVVQACLIFRNIFIG